jgi:hypothetical protein
MKVIPKYPRTRIAPLGGMGLPPGKGAAVKGAPPTPEMMTGMATATRNTPATRKAIAKGVLLALMD